jgi:GAF domain-containing protein
VVDNGPVTPDDAARAEAAEAELERAKTPADLLRATCIALVELLDAEASAISRIVGDLLVDVVQHSRSGRDIALGYGYLVSDYPLTEEVLREGEPRSVSLLDADADPEEARLLREMGFDALLMLALKAADRPWALVEVYDSGGRRFSREEITAAAELVRRAGEVLTDRLRAAREREPGFKAR